MSIGQMSFMIISFDHVMQVPILLVRISYSRQIQLGKVKLSSSVNEMTGINCNYSLFIKRWTMTFTFFVAEEVNFSS